MLNISETFSKAIYTNDAYDMVAIASIPLVGIAWSLFRQIKAKEQSNRCTTKNELFHMIQLKNRIKKLSAIGGLVQIAAVLGASILIGSLTPFGSFLLGTAMGFTGVSILTALYNEHRFRSPADINSGYNYVM